LNYETVVTPTNGASGTFVQTIRPGDGTWIDMSGSYTLSYEIHDDGSGVVSMEMTPTETCVTDPNGPPPQTICMPMPAMSAPIVFESEGVCEAE
jgi:hypothetical protein